MMNTFSEEPSYIPNMTKARKSHNDRTYRNGMVTD